MRCVVQARIRAVVLLRLCSMLCCDCGVVLQRKTDNDVGDQALIILHDVVSSFFFCKIAVLLPSAKTVQPGQIHLCVLSEGRLFSWE